MSNDFLSWCFLLLVVAMIISTVKIVFVDPIKDIQNRIKNENRDGDGI